MRINPKSCSYLSVADRLCLLIICHIVSYRAFALNNTKFKSITSGLVVRCEVLQSVIYRGCRNFICWGFCTILYALVKRLKKKIQTSHMVHFCDNFFSLCSSTEKSFPWRSSGIIFYVYILFEAQKTLFSWRLLLVLKQTEHQQQCYISSIFSEV